MKPTNKIALAAALALVVALAAPAVVGVVSPPPDTADYTVTVCTGIDVSISAVSGAFGDVLRGTSTEITDSFTLTNSGDWDAVVDAKFTTEKDGTYGMVSDTAVIPGTAFSLDPDDTGPIALKATNEDTQIGTIAQGGGTMTCDALLEVPSDQAPEAYSGTIQLTFSAAP
jgi:hypothetical protein